jgi:LysR family glycine cleavage system transcriptional activator
LSSPALSRRVQALERFVGKPLFERRHQAVLLNDEGAQLLAEIGPALEELGQAMERAAGHSELMRLKIGVLPLFASHRLVPRLGELRTLHPNLHVELDTRPHAITRLDEGLDAAIVLAKEVDESLYSVKLGVNRVVAVGGKGMETLRQPAQLAEATVLLHRDLPEAFDFWLESVGLRDLHPVAIDYFDSGQLILDAAAAGLGVAFMFEMHLEHAHDSRLVRLFDIAAPSPYAYWFVCRRAALSRRPLKTFHDWLMKDAV